MAKMSELPDVVMISKHQYERLLEDQKFLNALIAAGVDNWEGYQEALEYDLDD